MRILGIDPGLRLTGYACVESRSIASQPSVVEAGVFRLDAKSSISDRLMELEADLVSLIDRVQPQRVAVEAVFSHYAHPATAVVMGHARGVILLCARKASLDLLELRPAEIKKAATGYGRADKSQMQRAMQAAFGLAELPSPPDVADALAIALCGTRRTSLPPAPPLARALARAQSGMQSGAGLSASAPSPRVRGRTPR
jgi:crossover junction endodeoxyribonuclease RuvC